MSKNETSPLSLTYFLESIKKSRYRVKDIIIHKAINRIARSLSDPKSMLHMHNVIILIWIFN